jgi:hypothetical protein
MINTPGDHERTDLSGVAMLVAPKRRALHMPLGAASLLINHVDPASRSTTAEGAMRRRHYATSPG